MSIRVSGVKVDNADKEHKSAKFAAYEAAGKSIKACFRKNTAMGSALKGIAAEVRCGFRTARTKVGERL